MNKITFLSSTSSNYLFGKGRGKDKKKRKQRIPFTDAKDFVVGGKKFIKESNIKNPKQLLDAGIDIYNRKRDSSTVATKSTAALGALLGAAKGTALGAGIGSGVGTIRGFVQKNKTKKKK